MRIFKAFSISPLRVETRSRLVVSLLPGEPLVARFSYRLLVPRVPEREHDDCEGNDEHHERESDREDRLAIREIH
jgi:hypothetical protein